MFLKAILCAIIFLQECNLQDLNDTTRLPDAEEGDWVPRVVNGYPAKLGDVPYQVAMKALVSRRRRLYSTFCGGTIVATSKLISAAHCFHDETNKCHSIFYPGKASKAFLRSKYAVAGNLRNDAVYAQDSADGQWRPLKKAVYPKNYKFPDHDIAVVFTRRPFIFNEFIGAIPPALANTDYNGKCLVSGYGRTGSAKTNHSAILIMAHLELVPIKACARIYRHNMINFVCTSSTLTDVGKGDSGGPLVCFHTNDPNERDKRGVLIGVVSGRNTRRGTFFTRVSKYRKFIEECDPDKNECILNGISILNNNIKTDAVIAMTLIYRTFSLF